MILYKGKLLPDEQQKDVMGELQESCIRAISCGELTPESVIEACGTLSDRIKAGHYDGIIRPLLERGLFTGEQMAEAIAFFDRENLRYKYETELGILAEHTEDLLPAKGQTAIQRRYVPLGILFHMAAGNAQGLPFYSVVEGLLAGNVNILKLPSADGGLSVLLLQELIEINPLLAPYIVVFDIPSTNVTMLQKLGHMADAIVVWGGDEAIRAARTLAEPATQIISWGHKLSFAYVTPRMPEGELRALASHVCATNQLLCSSCQGIFVDTQDMDAVEKVGRDFLALLEEERVKYPVLAPGIRGKMSLSLYNEELEAVNTGRKVLRGKQVSVLIAGDCRLELSFMYRNCWVKPLPRERIVEELRPYRGYLQTAGLICMDSDRAYLSERLARAGLVRITHGGNMSRTVSGEAHDGEYALRRYSKVVETDNEK